MCKSNPASWVYKQIRHAVDRDKPWLILPILSTFCQALVPTPFPLDPISFYHEGTLYISRRKGRHLFSLFSTFLTINEKWGLRGPDGAENFTSPPGSIPKIYGIFKKNILNFCESFLHSPTVNNLSLFESQVLLAKVVHTNNNNNSLYFQAVIGSTWLTQFTCNNNAFNCLFSMLILSFSVLWRKGIADLLYLSVHTKGIADLLYLSVHTNETVGLSIPSPVRMNLCPPGLQLQTLWTASWLGKWHFGELSA